MRGKKQHLLLVLVPHLLPITYARVPQSNCHERLLALYWERSVRGGVSHLQYRPKDVGGWQRDAFSNWQHCAADRYVDGCGLDLRRDHESAKLSLSLGIFRALLFKESSRSCFEPPLGDRLGSLVVFLALWLNNLKVLDR